MSNNNSICIVIPSYNSKKTINQCLNSVLNQSFRDVQKVIVVDSSDDGTDENQGTETDSEPLVPQVPKRVTRGRETL